MIKFCCVHILQEAPFLRQWYFSLFYAGQRKSWRVWPISKFGKHSSDFEHDWKQHGKIDDIKASKSSPQYFNKAQFFHLYFFTYLETISPSTLRLKGGTNFQGSWRISYNSARQQGILSPGCLNSVPKNLWRKPNYQGRRANRKTWALEHTSHGFFLFKL